MKPYMVTKIMVHKTPNFWHPQKPTLSDSFDFFWKWLLGNKKPKMETKSSKK